MNHMKTTTYRQGWTCFSPHRL